MRTYAIGDIHGHLDKLQALHALIAADRDNCDDATAPVVHIGDLVDRGPDSRGVIDYLMRAQADGAPWVVLKGNHDRMFRGFLTDHDFHDPMLRRDLHWLHARLGGMDTIGSYGVTPSPGMSLPDLHDALRDTVPSAHLRYLDRLPAWYLRGECLFVHAGVRPGTDLRDQREDDLIWVRKEFIDDTRDHGVLIVHGHTPVEAVTHYGNRVNIDTGAGYGKPMSAIVLEGRRVFQLTENGREEVTP